MLNYSLCRHVPKNQSAVIKVVNEVPRHEPEKSFEILIIRYEHCIATGSYFELRYA